MTFPYNSTLPNPPNDPADDVPGMQINSGSISNIVAVDHVGFNVAGGGQHKQVTFNANNVPAVFPVTPPVLFTNTVAGLSQLFYYSGDAAHSSNQYYNSVSFGNAVQGSSVLLGGVIIKWGTFTITSPATTIAITFKAAFPNNGFSLTITGNQTNNNAMASYSGFGTSGFNGRQTTGNFSTTFTFIAIGN